MMEGVEHVTYLITRCTIMESQYLCTTAGQENNLADSLDSRVKTLLPPSLEDLYAAILEFLAKAGHYYGRGTAGKLHI